jgi:hypothetical protein
MSYETFLAVCRSSGSTGKRVMMNFLRGPLFFSDSRPGKGKGGVLQRCMSGHWSPIAGVYTHEGKDYVLVLDVNEKFSEYFAPVEALYKGVDTVNLLTGVPRGFVIIEDL